MYFLIKLNSFFCISDSNVFFGARPRDGLLQPDVEHLFALRRVHVDGHGTDAGAAVAVLHLADEGGGEDHQAETDEQISGKWGGGEK